MLRWDGDNEECPRRTGVGDTRHRVSSASEIILLLHSPNIQLTFAWTLCIIGMILSNENLLILQLLASKKMLSDDLAERPIIHIQYTGKCFSFIFFQLLFFFFTI